MVRGRQIGSWLGADVDLIVKPRLSIWAPAPQGLGDLGYGSGANPARGIDGDRGFAGGGEIVSGIRFGGTGHTRGPLSALALARSATAGQFRAGKSAAGDDAGEFRHRPSAIVGLGAK